MTDGSLIDCGVAALTLPGQSESGDRHVVSPFPNGVLAAVVDGLGHGTEAARAAETAIATLQWAPHESVIALVRRCNESLRGTRGVVMSLASFNAADETMTWLGVGNIEGWLLRVDPNASPNHESLLLRGGVVGGALPALRASIIPLVKGDTLIFATDGIRVPSEQELSLHGPPQQVAEHVLAAFGKGTDDALVFVARYIGPTP